MNWIINPNDNMDKKTIFAIVAAVIIVAAAAVVVVINSGDKEVLRNSNNLDGRLTVFGNANNDDFLDSRDVQFVKDVIAGTSSRGHSVMRTSTGRSTRPMWT